tara:strand:+ start:796 stop:918 length:123 start_codon:yes stop_codon:yes gene_type:complete
MFLEAMMLLIQCLIMSLMVIGLPIAVFGLLYDKIKEMLND